MFDLWVEFNDIERRGRIVASIAHAEPGVRLRWGRRIVVGDYEGNTARAVVRRVRRRRGLVTVRLIPGTFMGSDAVADIESFLVAVRAELPETSFPSYAEICQRYDENPALQRRIDDLVADLDAEDARRRLPFPQRPDAAG
ncbi:hypothetical protein I6A60_40475 [Frankia sp. AgB1.9]|uniref:hypothetical protein n=1 Tax=unclassified Frankia TaxID=2632575 RepID=UPI001932C2D0|nr:MULTISPECIES: hypothetical protein [unclassified Frankia]MBL7486527.1 hypothetical protein [Frankia sp. AgW1.1]MBL7554056.1 hypothetical protein [Frankia sp. AgB1.9]MBL7618254.1 hypothetical protein [Frankia sp. AgB1.8]